MTPRKDGDFSNSEAFMTAQRIYLIGTPDSKVRLVKATTRSQALSHIAHQVFTVRVATQDDLVDNLGKGIKVEPVTGGDQLSFEE